MILLKRVPLPGPTDADDSGWGGGTVQLAEHILFFHSTWYAKLSPDTDGETVLDKLDEAYKELKDIDNLKRIDELEITW